MKMNPHEASVAKLLKDLEAAETFAASADPAEALARMAELSNRASECADPALHGIFRALAVAAWRIGDAGLACNAAAMCLEYTTRRKRYSAASCAAVARLATVAAFFEKISC